MDYVHVTRVGSSYSSGPTAGPATAGWVTRDGEAESMVMPRCWADALAERDGQPTGLDGPTIAAAREWVEYVGRPEVRALATAAYGADLAPLRREVEITLWTVYGVRGLDATRLTDWRGLPSYTDPIPAMQLVPGGTIVAGRP